MLRKLKDFHHELQAIHGLMQYLHSPHPCGLCRRLSNPLAIIDFSSYAKYPVMKYEWNEDKATANLSKHGVTFEEAKTSFDDPLYVDFYDPDHSYGEHRYILIGKSHQGRLLFVSYMERNDIIRLISGREATQLERKAYEQN